MHRIKKVLLAALSLIVLHGYGQCSVATAANVGGGGVSGLRTHDHSSAGKGGTTLSGTTLSGTTLSGTTTIAAGATLNNGAGTITGGTVNAITLSGVTTISGAFTGTAACDSGYVRALPNLCVKQGSVATTALVRDTCTAITLPTRAKALLVYFTVSVKSANVAGVERFGRVSAWADSGCAVTRIVNKLTAIYEFSAVVSGTEIGASEGQEVLQTPGGTWLIFEDDAGDTSTGGYEIRGYFDN